MRDAGRFCRRRILQGSLEQQKSGHNEIRLSKEREYNQLLSFCALCLHCLFTNVHFLICASEYVIDTVVGG